MLNKNKSIEISNVFQNNNLLFPSQNTKKVQLLSTSITTPPSNMNNNKMTTKKKLSLLKNNSFPKSNILVLPNSNPKNPYSLNLPQKSSIQTISKISARNQSTLFPLSTVIFPPKKHIPTPITLTSK